MYRSIKRPRILRGGPVGLSDKSLVCRECGVEFLFTEGEQDFYQHAIVCATCGRDAEVPFQPRLGRPVYCSDCFTAERAMR